jgi:hypothetical protein
MHCEEECTGGMADLRLLDGLPSIDLACLIERFKEKSQSRHLD